MKSAIEHLKAHLKSLEDDQANLIRSIATSKTNTAAFENKLADLITAISDTRKALSALQPKAPLFGQPIPVPDEAAAPAIEAKPVAKGKK